jgi:integrase/recombinase XerD
MLPLLNEFKEKLIRDGLFPNTIGNMIKALVYFDRYTSKDVRKISKADIEKYKVYLMTEYTTNIGKRLCNQTITLRLRAIRDYFKFLTESKIVFFDPALNITIPKKTKYHLPEYIPTEKDIEELLNKPDVYTYVGIRDRLLIELSYTCPLRNQELRELEVSDIDMKEKFIYPKRAKRGRECGIPIAEKKFEVLKKYLDISRPRLLKSTKTATDRLFITENGEGFKQSTINEIFIKYRGSKRIHPHSMRHACAIHMLRHGAGIRDIQVLLGHRDVKSTCIYTMLTVNDLKDVIEKFHPREQKNKSTNPTK